MLAWDGGDHRFRCTPHPKTRSRVGWILGVANVFAVFAFNEYARFRANALLGWGEITGFGVPLVLKHALRVG
jgi:hypothetical protein